MDVIVDGVGEVESLITGYFGWPLYAIRTIGTLMVGLGSMLAVQYVTESSKVKKAGEKEKKSKIPKGFRLFQIQYLSVSYARYVFYIAIYWKCT